MPIERSLSSVAFQVIRENPRPRQDFHEFGQSIASWAKHHNFNPRLVYAVLRGERKCIRGQSYEIAKELGMK